MKDSKKSVKLNACITFPDEAAKEKFVKDIKATGRSVSGFLKFAGMNELSKSATVILLFIGLSVNAQDALSLPKQTYIEIYKGLKAEEYYRQANTDCIEISNSLNAIIQQQNDSLQLSMSRLDEVNYELDYLNHQYQEAIKERPAPWYKSPWLWSGLGLFSGILITK